MEDMLNEKENLRLTRRVMDYHAMEDGPERDAEREKLREKTELLMFLIPLQRGYLSRQDASGFYLEQKPNALFLMENYRITKLLFMDYMAQVLRRRCITYVIRQNRRNSDWMKLNYIEARSEIDRNFEVHEMEIDYTPKRHGEVPPGVDLRDDGEGKDEVTGKGGAVTAEGPSPLRRAEQRRKPGPPAVKDPLEDRDLEELGLREIITHMSVSRAYCPISECSEGEKSLRTKLESDRMREQFIELMLYIPGERHAEMSSHLSRVLGVKAEVIDRFFFLRNEASGADGEKLQKDRELANRHFRMMMKTDCAFLTAEDDEERERLLRKSRKLRKAYSNKIHAVRTRTGGMSQRQIAALLGKSRSLISSNLSRVRSMLEESLSEVMLQYEDADDRIVSI